MANSTTHTTSTSTTQSQSKTQALLDEALRDSILSGLKGYMTDEQIAEYAENLLKPVLNANLEAAQQEFDTAKLSREQEIENLAVQLAQAIDKQNQSYTQNRANLENAALARGMGRSSYLLDTEAQLGQALSAAIQQLTDENTRQTGQIQRQITQAADQLAQTQGRLNTDYASQLSAKLQELKDAQRQEYNQYYMSATSAAMGSQTTGTSTTNSTSTSTTQTGSGGSGGGRSSKNTGSDENLYVGETGNDTKATSYGGGAGLKAPLEGKKMYVH